MPDYCELGERDYLERKEYFDEVRREEAAETERANHECL